MKSLLNRFDDLSRRRFMNHAALSFLGVGAMPLLDRAAQAAAVEESFPLRPATAKNVIYLYMSGGMTHLDTLDPKPGHENQGPVEAIKTSADGVLLSQHLPNMAKHMHHAAVINSLSSTQGAHAQGRYFMHTSYTMRGTIKHPSMGSWLMKMSGKRNPTLPGHVAIGGGVDQASGGFFESKYAPLPIGDPDSGLKDSARASNVTAETFNRRVSAAEEMNRALPPSSIKNPYAPTPTCTTKPSS